MTTAAPKELPLPLIEKLELGIIDYHHRDAIAAGIHPQTIQRWVRHGFLTPISRGDYLISTQAKGKDTHEERRLEYLQRCKCILHGHPGYYLVGASALCAYGIPLLSLPEKVEVSRLPRGRTRTHSYLTSMPWGSKSSSEIDGIPCRPLAEAVIENAAHHGIRAGIVAADAVLHAGLSVESLADALQMYGHRPGASDARVVTELADGRIESPGESLFRLVLHGLRIDATPQVVLQDGTGHFIARVDFLLHDAPVVLEFNGLMKYSSPDVLRQEKLRQMLIEEQGYTVLRFSFRDLNHPEHVRDMIFRAVRLHRGAVLTNGSVTHTLNVSNAPSLAVRRLG